MNTVKNHIFTLFIFNGTISTTVVFIMFCFILCKKKKDVFSVLVSALLATNCVNSISLCFIGIFNIVPFNQHEANFTTPHSCLFIKPYYLLAVTSTKQSPMISFCIAVVQVQNACSIRCSTKMPLLKTTIFLCGISLLNICLTGTTLYYGTGGNNWQRKVSEFCLFIDVISPELIFCDTIIILLFSTLSLLLYISTVLIIWSRISTSHVIHEIRLIRQKAILQRLKIFIIAQLLNSGTFALCSFVVTLSFSSPAAVPYFWCFLPLYKAGMSVFYTNQVISVIKQFTEIYYNLKKWLNSLRNALFHCFHKTSVAPTSPKDFSIFPSNAVAVENLKIT
ncbi:hypothetical protein T08_1311 [Trichinella sp. T8]|nr:hypothetical protein T08_1311 [Trichinella sp. T8]